MHRLFKKSGPALLLSFKNANRQILMKLTKNLIAECTLSSSLIRQKSTAVAKDPFANGATAIYIEKMYNSWLNDPASVHPSWDAFFSSNSYSSPVDLAPIQRNMVPLSSLVNAKTMEDQMTVLSVIGAYQSRGHFAADLDPLGLWRNLSAPHASGRAWRANEDVLQEYSAFLTDKNKLDKKFVLPNSTYIGGEEKELKLSEIVDRLEKVYCRSIGIEYCHLNSFEEIDWIRKNFESPEQKPLTKDEKVLLFQRLERACSFESFLAKKYASEKRFGLEGCDAMIPSLKEIIDKSTLLGIEGVNIGLAHRGRLNVLANICRKPLHQLYSLFIPLESPDAGSGDVKYHLGTFVERVNRATKKNVRLCVVANPSHLEAVNPVVQGKTRAEQFYRCDTDGKRFMAVLIHGDAAFSAQGIVYESINFANLPAFSTHGTIHIVTNNQVGFTVNPNCGRSSPYCTDVARIVGAPVFHVNADDPEAVIAVSRVAAEWRATFHKDVVIDIVGYRRNGHNESDEPMFTQPIMYKKIKETKPINEKYAAKLVSEGTMTADQVKKYADEYQKICEEAFELSKKETLVKYKDWLDSPWTGFFEGRDHVTIAPTGVKRETLEHIANVFSCPPQNQEDFELHNGVKRILKSRTTMIEESSCDWAMGEALAFGSLLKEGIHVRMSGQDVERGTFSHRHHVYHHQKVPNMTYNPLCHLYPDQASYTIANSSLSEYGVLGFEHGFSVTSPNALVLWEAQFGDFCNTAQGIIDQFISSGQAKWVRQSGLVMLLPHGMEGQGPEHSSARLERFLQLSNDDPKCVPDDTDEFVIQQLHDTNWIVANCTTPANLFHILRRQIALPFRKPLILMTPKSLLRHPLAKSNFSEMTEGTEFMRLIPDCITESNPCCVEKIVFCSGRVYYDLLSARADRNADERYAIVRIEQISPFPYDLVKQQLTAYKEAEVVWSQEEHQNQGPWSYVDPRFRSALSLIDDKRVVSYQGRDPAAAAATGNKKQHEYELEKIIEGIFGKMTNEQKEALKRKKDDAVKATQQKSADAAKSTAEAAASPKAEEADKPKTVEVEKPKAEQPEKPKENKDDENPKNE